MLQVRRMKERVTLRCSERARFCVTMIIPKAHFLSRSLALLLYSYHILASPLLSVANLLLSLHFFFLEVARTGNLPGYHFVHTPQN